MTLESLKPFRSRIDDLDDRIVALLGERFAVVREVAAVKEREGIATRLPERVEEVRARNAERGAQQGLDRQFVRDLYGAIIDEACRLEDALIADKRAQ